MNSTKLKMKSVKTQGNVSFEDKIRECYKMTPNYYC